MRFVKVSNQGIIFFINAAQILFVATDKTYNCTQIKVNNKDNTTYFVEQSVMEVMSQIEGVSL